MGNTVNHVFEDLRKTKAPNIILGNIKNKFNFLPDSFEPIVKKKKVKVWLFVGQTSLAVHISVDSSSDLSCSTRYIVWLANFDVSLHQLSQTKAR
jgi:hypothetical protein